MVVIVPGLMDHVTKEPHREANVLKKRPNMHEERHASHGGGKGNVSFTMGKQANEIQQFVFTDKTSGARGSS